MNTAWIPRRHGSGGSVGRWAIAGLSVLDIAAAAVLSAFPVAVALGAPIGGDSHAGVAACLGVLVLTVPLAWRRPLPIAAAGVMAAGALANGLAFGPLVRCGVALPAIYLVAFAIGARYPRRLAAAGLLLCAADVVIEGYYDPRIGWSGLTAVVPVLIAFFAVGWLLQQRDHTARTLRARSAELRRRREERAQLAVLADRAQLSADIGQTLQARLDAIADTAAAGNGAADPAVATQALAAIEHDGRAALGELREVVGTLRTPETAEPQPDLAKLPELLTMNTTARTRLTVEGQPRRLPAGLELSGYRIVEHLVQAFEDAPDAAVDVRLCYRPEALELHVTGTTAPGAELTAVLAAARQRALLHGGTVHTQVSGGTCHATALLPLISGLA
jgi:Histidine kinase